MHTAAFNKWLDKRRKVINCAYENTVVNLMLLHYSSIVDINVCI